MPSGQTQKVYGHNEKALAPESIGDIHRMLGESKLTSQITNYRIVSGVMFFEVSRARWVEQRGYAPYFRYHLVAGEDPEEKGCLVSMHLSHGIQRLDVLHMQSMWDTRGGIRNVAWCSAFQFKRKIFDSGTNSRSYTAIRTARGDYCKKLLRVFDDSKSLENQDWHAIQVCHYSYRFESLADTRQNIIDRHKRLFHDCLCEQCRTRRLEARAGDGNGDDDNDNDRNNRGDRPRPDRNDNDDDGVNHDNDSLPDWQHELNRLRRHRMVGFAAEDNEDNSQGDDQDLINMEDDIDANVGMQDDINEDFYMDDDAINTDGNLFSDGSQSPFRFVAHSREPSPDVDTHPAPEFDDLDDTLNIDYDHIYDIDVDHITTSPSSPSSTIPDSPIEPKLEPKVEPEADFMTHTGYTRSKHTRDLIDLTGDDDDSTGSENSVMEVIELTEDSDTNMDPTRLNYKYDAMIDLTRDSEDSQSGSDMQVIELDD